MPKEAAMNIHEILQALKALPVLPQPNTLEELYSESTRVLQQIENFLRIVKGGGDTADLPPSPTDTFSFRGTLQGIDFQCYHLEHLTYGDSIEIGIFESDARSTLLYKMLLSRLGEPVAFFPSRFEEVPLVRVIWPRSRLLNLTL